MSSTRPHPAAPASKSISLGWLVIPLVVLSLAIVVMRSRPAGVAGQDSPAIGKPAPRLDLIRLSAQPNFDRVESVASDKLTLIHFWGTWCGPCKMEYPELASMVSRLNANPGFEFVSVSCEAGPSETFDGLYAKTLDYLQSQGIEGSAFADPQGVSRRSAAERLERPSMFYPTTILVGGDQTIVGVWEGYAPGAVEQMELLSKRLLESIGPAT